MYIPHICGVDVCHNLLLAVAAVALIYNRITMCYLYLIFIGVSCGQFFDLDYHNGPSGKPWAKDELGPVAPPCVSVNFPHCDQSRKIRYIT